MNLTTTRICMSLRHNLYPITSKLIPQKVADHLPIPFNTKPVQLTACKTWCLWIGNGYLEVLSQNRWRSANTSVYSSPYNHALPHWYNFKRLPQNDFHYVACQFNNLSGANTSLHLRKVRKTIFGRSQLCVGVAALRCKGLYFFETCFYHSCYQ